MVAPATQSLEKLRNVTERGSEQELSGVAKLAQLFDSVPLTLEEKLVNPGLFLRRQELSYVLANYEIFKKVQHVKGSIFYYGVFHGAGLMTFANLAAALEPFNHTRELVGFDTFEGYPEITDKDLTHGEEYRTLVKGGFGSDSEAFLKEFMKFYDSNRPLNHIPKIRLVRGDVCKTLPVYIEKNQHTVISLAIFTMNLYEATKEALDITWSRMPVGGICVIHSMNEEYYPGATRATFDVLGSSISIQTFPFAPNLAYVVKEK